MSWNASEKSGVTPIKAGLFSLSLCRYVSISVYFTGRESDTVIYYFWSRSLHSAFSTAPPTQTILLFISATNTAASTLNEEANCNFWNWSKADLVSVAVLVVVKRLKIMITDGIIPGSQPYSLLCLLVFSKYTGNARFVRLKLCFLTYDLAIPLSIYDIQLIHIHIWSYPPQMTLSYYSQAMWTWTKAWFDF